MMQSNEQSYRDQIQQDDYFDTDLADAHRKLGGQTAQVTSAAAKHTNDANELAERFMQTLQQTEASGNVDSLTALFADDADLINLTMTEPLQGRESIQQFWQHYVSVFDRIQSHFTHVSIEDGTIVLEWHSEGALSSGKPFSYRGVSILETENGQVQHFRTYYDSAVFLPQGT